jgi:hypothetical protein
MQLQISTILWPTDMQPRYAAGTSCWWEVPGMAGPRGIPHRMSPDELRAEAARKRAGLNRIFKEHDIHGDPSQPPLIPAVDHSVRVPNWPGGGFAPMRPHPGAHAEVVISGTKGRSAWGIPAGRSKTTAYVHFTSPKQPSTTRTIKGNMTIRYAMDYVDAFNKASGTF